MKFLIDQDVYAVTTRLLRSLGHEVLTASEANLSRVNDADLLRTAQNQERILVTRDRDFGGLVFARGPGPGVIYLRVQPSTLQAMHKELERVLKTYSEKSLKQAFVVVEPGRHRFRKLPGA